MPSPEVSNKVTEPWYKAWCASLCSWFLTLRIIGTYIWFDIIQGLCITAIGIFVEATGSAPVIEVEKIEKRTGQVAVITGGPRGLAVGLLKRLLQLDYTIFMGVRSMSDSKRRFEQFAKDNPDLPTHNVQLMQMELMSLKTVRKFAEDLLSKVDRIDLLLCNAANMREPYRLSEDGYESQFQVNYFGHFMLTQLLLEKLKVTASRKGSPCHVIYTSTMAHERGKFYFDELTKPKIFTPCKFYFASKLCQVTSMIRLNKILEREGVQIHCSAVHPGLVPTDLWYTGGNYVTGRIGQMFQSLFRTVENGADTILWPAFSEDFKNTGGLYMANGLPRKPADEALNEGNQTRLFDMSLELMDKKFA